MEKENIKKCVTVERVQSVFKQIDNLVVKAIQEKNRALLKIYENRLGRLLGIAEGLRLQFLFGAAFMLPYAIGDEISSCQNAISEIEKIDKLATV